MILSIIIPVRNEYRLLDLCEALIMQDLKDTFQIVIVDESDQNYIEIVSKCFERLRQNGINVELIHNTVRQGVGYSMVQGLLRAKGLYVFFMDADNRPVNFFTNRIIEEIMRKKEVAAISFLSVARHRSSLSNKLLLVPRLYLSCLTGSLRYDKRYGFVNTLWVFRRDVLLNSVGTEIEEPTLSYLDDPSIRRKLRTVLSSSITSHINEILIEDVRNLYEDYNVKFIFARTKWYYESLLELLHSKKLNFAEKVLLAKDMVFYVLLLPITVFTLMKISTFFISHPFYAYSVLVALLTTYIAVNALLMRRRNIHLSKETIQAMITLPVLLIINSLATYYTLFKLAFNKRLKR